MTVQELIEILKTHPPEAIVKARDWEGTIVACEPEDVEPFIHDNVIEVWFYPT